ncbi:MAG TPA: chromate resistance protein ChrB domain-containing protein [Alphaproteobacteria bacterium]
MKWITRARPKIDRIACPWLVSRFIDREAEFLFVPADRVLAMAEEQNATPFDVPNVELGHAGAQCSFDAFIRKYALDDPVLRELAPIVRAADTGHLAAAHEAPGLYAMSYGLSALYADDHEMMRHGFVMYDALYAWLKHARGSASSWPPTE